MSRLAAGCAVVLALWAGLAGAGVEGTHHDMRLYSLQGEQSVCAYCHVPHRAATDENLLAREGAYQSELGRVGAFCYTCHDGTVVPTALVEAPDGTLGIEALTRSHGLTLSALADRTDGLETLANVQASGLVAPAEDGSLPDRMECTACHDPHNNENRPFLRLPLAELCAACHSGQDRQGDGRYTAVTDAGTRNRAHPVGMPVAWSGNDRTRPDQVEPEMTFNAVDPALRVPGLARSELGDPSRHWQTGGHLSDFGTDPGTGRVTCSTCHSAHSVGENLLVLPVADREQGTDPLCAGCHGQSGTPQNPGGTPYYHPVLGESVPPYETSTVPHRPLAVAVPEAWPLADRGSLLCTTCHRAHRGRPGAKCLRENPVGGPTVCDACHLADDDLVEADLENAHHVTTTRDASGILGGRALSWSGGSGTPGDLADGLTCPDCHTELAKSAHNW